MSTPGIDFEVAGLAVPQGSKTAFVKAGRAIVTESNRSKLKPWRASIADAAAAAMNGAGLMTGPVLVTLAIHWPRPRAHFGKGSKAETLKPDAPSWVTTRPDLEKVARSVLDAMTGIVYRDDAQVAELLVQKLYAEPPRIVVSVTELGPGPARSA